MPTKLWTADADKRGLTLQGARITIAFTRTKILGLRVYEYPLHGSRGDAVPLPLRFVVRGTRVAAWANTPIEAGSDSRLDLELDYAGEEPILTSVEWLRLGPSPDFDELADVDFVSEWAKPLLASSPRRHRDRLLVRSRNRGVPPPPADSEVEPDSLLDSTTAEEEAAAYFKDRRDALERTYRVARFFANLDELTAPRMFGESNSLTKTQTNLARTLSYRAKLGDAGNGYSSPPSDSASGSLKSVTNVFEASRSWQDANGNTVSLEETDLPFAFELFVSGRLSVVAEQPSLRDALATHGAPNSWQYFLFVELALAAARGHTFFFSDAERATWLARVPFFVRTAHLLATYHWTNIAIASVPVTPYAYFDGYSMSLVRIESSRKAYEGWPPESTSAAALASPESTLRRWEDLWGKILTLVSPAHVKRVDPGISPMEREDRPLSAISLPDLPLTEPEIV